MKRMNTLLAKCRVTECWIRWYICLPLGLKVLNHRGWKCLQSKMPTVAIKTENMRGQSCDNNAVLFSVRWSNSHHYTGGSENIFVSSFCYQLKAETTFNVHQWLMKSTVSLLWYAAWKLPYLFRSLNKTFFIISLGKLYQMWAFLWNEWIRSELDTCK
jgi:hypothetical protein